MNDSIENHLGEFFNYGDYFAKLNKVVNENLISVSLFNAKGSKFVPKYKKITDFHVVPIKDLGKPTAKADVDTLKGL